MRLRNIPRAEGVLKECSQVIETPEEFRDHWHLMYSRMTTRSTLKSAWEKAVFSWHWLRKIHRSTTSESSATQASFSVLWKS